MFAPAGCLRAAATRIAWQQFVLPRLVRRSGIDLLYCPSYTAPLAANCRLIVSLHDLIAWTHPRVVGWKNVVHFRMLVGQTVSRADAVCVPTNFVQRAVIRQFGVSPERVFIVPWGVDAEIAPMPRAAAERHVQRQFGMDGPFVLFCGCLEAKKNIEMALRATEGAGVRMVIAGPWISGSSSLLARPNNLSGNHWQYVGYVTPAELSALYSAATALVFPSLAEGFGLPPIEAMSCGCPVIASDIPALREVCGGNALHVASRDVGAWTAALREVIGSAALREELANRGLARARQFRWAVAVDCFREALDFALSRSPALSKQTANTNAFAASWVNRVSDFH
jgi:glycosyltransferase involved in cell wall biosynthesis